MPRIEVDPTQETCPSFEDPEWEFLRQNMVDAHQGVPALTMDEASQRMKEAWARAHQRKLDAWNAQVQQDQVEQERIDGETRDAQEAQRVQQEKEAEEMRKEVDKKKPKLNSIDQNLYVGKFIAARPATYALNKLSNLEYVELDYFTPKGCREAAADSNKSVSQDTLTFTQVGDSFAIRPMAALRPSKHIRSDEELSWEEMMDAKNVMLHFMAKSRVWEDEHATALATFYINLDCHQRKDQKNGKLTLLLYQSRVRREWFDALKRDEGFNIALIEDDLLRNMAEEVGNAVQDRENAVRDRDVDQVLCPKLKISHPADRVHFFPPLPSFSHHLLRLLDAYVPPSAPPIANRYLPFAICHLPFALCHLPFATPLPPRATHR